MNTTAVVAKVFEEYQKSKNYRGFEVNDKKLNTYLESYLTAEQSCEVNEIFHDIVAESQEKCFTDGVKFAIKFISECIND